jgi:hypothetical protein
MEHRPLPVTLIGYLFIATGAVGIIYHAPELREIVSRLEVSWVLFVRMLAIVGGAFILRGASWARWLLLVWIIYHVILSFFHATPQLIMHAGLMIVLIIALFHPKANAFFKKK